MNTRLLAPFALLPVGCVTAHGMGTTPSTEASDRPREVFDRREVSVPSAEAVMARWQLPFANPWSAYTKLTLFSALGSVSETRVLPRLEPSAPMQRARAAAAHVAALGLPTDALWLVDLRGPESVVFGTTLSEHAAVGISLVVTFNNWSFDRELIPTSETLAALVSYAPRLPEPATRTLPVFLLDAWRLAYASETTGPEFMDNRYALSASDLPEPEALLAEGIRHVVYVVDKRAPDMLEEDDLNDRLNEYQDAGIELSLVDLDELSGLPAPASPPPAHFVATVGRPTVWSNWLFEVAPRTTVLRDPEFYHRCHSGFGGLAAARVAMSHGSSAFAAAHGGGHGGG